MTIIYIFLKIVHIASASMLLAAMGYSYDLWRRMRSQRDGAIRSERIQAITWLLIVPLALMQLATGFTMISIQHEDISQLWITGSVIGFVMVIGTWLTFAYCLLLSQQVEIKRNLQPSTYWLQHRRIQSCLLALCAMSLFIMIFFMTNKVA